MVSDTDRPRYRSRRGATGVLAAALVAGIGMVPARAAGERLERARADIETRRLIPRSVPVKPARTVIPPDHSDQVIHVKFREETGVRLRGGTFATLRNDDTSGLTSVLREHPAIRIERLFSRAEEILEKEKLRIEAKSNREQGDKNLWYRVRLPAGTDLARLIDDLNALEIVEIAYAEPLPAPPPTRSPARDFTRSPELPAAVPAVTPDFSDEQGYLDPAPDGIDARAAWDVCGGRGNAVDIIDIEYSWNDDHEDLAAANGGLIANKTPQDPFSSNDHGTAVLGEMIATDNGFGVIGIVPDSGINMVNANNSEDGYDLADSIDLAHANVGAGDLILIEQQTSGPNGCNNGVSGCVAVEWVEAYYDAIVSATSDGIHVIEAAGNGGENLDDTATYGNPFPDGRADSGAIIVGSGGVEDCINPERSRRPSSTYGARVNLQGWGECVTTTGYGALQGGPDPNIWYTSGFNGTSSASPIVTGAAASLSSVAQTLGAVTLTPTEVRSKLIAGGTAQNTGAGTLSGNIGPLPDLKETLAEYETVPPELSCPASVTAECTSPAGANVSFTVTATDDCDSSPDVTCTHDSGDLYTIGSTPNSCAAQDAVDNEDTCDFPVNVVDTTAPITTCPGDVTVECTGNLGIDVSDPQLSGFFAGVSAVDVCDATLVLSNDAPAFFGLGATLVTFGATDDATNVGTCTATVTVLDTIAPTIEVTLNRDVLWPPNHKLADITASVVVADVCDPNPSFVLTSITSDEPDNGLGDGDQPNDIQNASYGTADTAFKLRSERSGPGDGRTYTIVYTASDSSLNTAWSTSTVRVPHSKSGIAESSSGFDASGTGFGSPATRYHLLVLSTAAFDARRVDVRDAMVGNHVGVVRAIGHRYVDADRDGLTDLELTYPVEQTVSLRSKSRRKYPLGLHYDVGPDLEDYLVPDIFTLGSPLLAP